MKQSNIEIMPMTEAHVSQVAALERACFADPWPEEILRSELQNSLSLWLVAVSDGVVAGYVGSQGVIDAADMMNLAVRQEFRRQGIAERLIGALEEALLRRGMRSLTLEVRPSNTAAAALYEKLGFVQVGRRPRYYFNPVEDALILRKELVKTQ